MRPSASSICALKFLVYRMRDLAEEGATQVLLNRWGHALARLLEATAAHKRRHDYIAADGRMDLDEFRRLVRTGFEGEGPRGEGAEKRLLLFTVLASGGRASAEAEDRRPVSCTRSKRQTDRAGVLRRSALSLSL